MLNVGDTERDPWVRFSCKLDHTRREIDAGAYDSQFCGLQSKRTWPSSHIQKSSARPNPRCIEERANRQRRYWRKEVLISRRQLVVPLTFKGTQAICIFSRQRRIACGHRPGPVPVAMLAPPIKWLNAGHVHFGSKADIDHLHSMTSSARSRIDGGTVRPSALAVLAFTAISNFTGT